MVLVTRILSSGFRTKWHSGFRDYLENWNFTHSKFTYETFQKAKNKGADQTARMYRLVCACVVCKPSKTGFLASRPIYSLSLLRKKNVVRFTDCLDMTIAVDWDVKPQNTQKGLSDSGSCEYCGGNELISSPKPLKGKWTGPIVNSGKSHSA